MTEFPKFLRARLFTAFGTVFFVDPATGELRHGAVEVSPANAYFESEDGSAGGYRQGRLVYVADGSPEPIHCYPDICLTTSQSRHQDRSDGATTLELIPLERGLLTLKSGDLFLSAIPDGRVMHRASICSTWELFIASESWCTNSLGLALNGAWRRDEAAFNKGNIARHIVDPLTRMKSVRQPQAKKILIYGYTKWSHGRVYYDLCRHLHDRGYLVDILDWQQNHVEYARELFPYYDFVISALDGISTLVDTYDVPFDKIIAISHHEFDMRMLIEQKGIEVFERFANYGVVSESLYSASAMRGIARSPMVAPLGVDSLSFFSTLPERLATVGYTTSLSVTTYGVEWKRGELAETAVREAGLVFKVAGSTANQISFHDMPDFYRGVDAVLSSSVNESGPLSVLEGAAAGRLVIGTPVGHFPLKAYHGAGLVAPIEPKKFVAFASYVLRYYRDNPAAFVDKCRATREAALKFDWSYFIDDWIQLIEQPGQSGHSADFDNRWFERGIFGTIRPKPESAQADRTVEPPKIYLINLDKSIGRLSHYMENNPHLSNGTVRVSAIEGASVDRSKLVRDGTIAEDCTYRPGSLGCALSHISLWKFAISENRPITIFEDDVYASVDFFRESALLTSKAPADWDLIKWGFIFDPLFLWLDMGFSKAKLEFYERQASKHPRQFQTDSYSRSLFRIAHSFGLQAYTITPRGARILLEKCLPLQKRLIPFPGTGVVLEDTGIDCAMCAAYSSMQAFVCVPPLVIPDDTQPSDRVIADHSS
ncbi:glycosyltransferase family 25 protein [Mesorhizobium sp. B1-1-8]|uniref:glycosyltransferase family 25 protein n=1 Tax=Mesorhizobium sp. B1-1-8 TaxID=2589976 RepID=UPI00112C39FB|nr:glycosyltransferase family 25 protein [Mesorhizobium sp. B1-1-8]UCI09541.1 glycosyltransferase family 25 protein [Mesorhizobium sp. B1-1-8]